MVGFGDLVGVDIVPVSKKMAFNVIFTKEPFFLTLESVEKT